MFVVDDDASVREAFGSLFRSVGLRVALFESAVELLAKRASGRRQLLVLDVRLPSLSGLGLPGPAGKAGIHIPIVFVTGHGDIPMSVRAMKAGAVDFLPKPFRDQDMLDAVAAALERDRQRRARDTTLEESAGLLRALSQRERQVMALVV